MRIVIIGATGTIGGAVAEALGARHEIIRVSHGSTEITVDLAAPDSIRAMYERVGRVDAVVCAAGQARFVPLGSLSDEDLSFSLANKLMGQVNVIRYGMEHLNDGGSFTLTSGILASHPTPGSAAISLVNSGVEGFARAAALEAPRGIRVNVVSPPWVAETLEAMGRSGADGAPASVVAEYYARSVEGSDSGKVMEVPVNG